MNPRPTLKQIAKNYLSILYKPLAIIWENRLFKTVKNIDQENLIHGDLAVTDLLIKEFIELLQAN